jgi:hypothetical protein
VAEHFSAEDLAAVADKCSQPACPFYLSAGTLVTNASASEPGRSPDRVGAGEGGTTAASSA